MAPFDVTSLAGTFAYAAIFLAIGMAFGATLEMAGFGDSRKLAAQFYLRDMTVLKVMFTAIVVAAVLLFLCSAFGWLDFSRVWVNPTYVGPEIVGGLIMGVGFIVGGFCPGTSLVAASTLKLDGIFFVLGGLCGAFLFGETVGGYESFFLSSYLGRFTVPDWLGLPAGVVVLLVVLLAVGMFWAAELAEQYFGQRRAWADVRLRPRSVPKLAGAGALVLLALVATVRGQPTPEQRYGWIAATADRLVRDRAIFVNPAEIVAMRKDPTVIVRVLDVRDEHDFNLFHIADARRTTPDDLQAPGFVKTLLDQPANSVAFVVGNGEAAALDAWRTLKGQGVVNVYVIEGGINHWLELYPPPACVAGQAAGRTPDELGWRFAYATGGTLPSARPDVPTPLPPLPCAATATAEAGGTHEPAAFPDYPYEKKVKLQVRKVVRGGCG